MRFRLIPVLILVALMSCIFRASEIITGSLKNPGQAVAESDKKSDSKKEDAQKEPTKNTSEKGSDKKPEENKEPVVAKTPEEIQKEKDILKKWKDASDNLDSHAGIESQFYEDLQETRKQLEQRSKDLDARNALLIAAEKEIDQKYAELTLLRDEIKGFLNKQSEEEKARIQSLVIIYEGMKPKDAARIFDTMDLDVLIPILSGINERKASPILAAMNPERARTVTSMLIEEKQLPDAMKPQ
jgi:flagellar motility protein MotE (MotC chaperone)